MSKKDFVALADKLQGLDVPNEVLTALVDFCKGQNHNFKEGLWLGYLRGECGSNGGKRKDRTIATTL